MSGSPHATPFDDAVRIWWTKLREAGCPEQLATETISLASAAGRAPAALARSKDPCPTYRAAAMDGYAVRARDLTAASNDRPVRLKIGAAAVTVDTGSPMPADKDAVLPAEAVSVDGASIVVSRPTHAGKHVRLPGDDVPPGVAIAWPGIPLRPVDCAALISSGLTSIDVVRRPRVTVIPSGDEIVAPGSQPGPGAVIDSNSSMIAASARARGAAVVTTAIIADDDDALDAALAGAIERSDVVLLLAGSSRGDRDRGARAIERAGTVDVRGVATRPARPVILGHAGHVAIVNLPGYPVACAFAFDAYVAPLLRRLGGIADPPPRRARLARAAETDGTCDEWRLASVLTSPGSPRAVVDPLEDIGGGLYQLARADARFRLKRGTTRHARYVAVGWTPLRDDAANAPLFAGPYDPLIEEIAALAGFRCRWTTDETGEALDDGTAEAAGIVVRGRDIDSVHARAGEHRRMLVIGARREGIARARSADTDVEVDAERPDLSSTGRSDPWEAAASVASGVRTSVMTTKYLAERFGLRFEERGSVVYAIVWEERPGRRFPWGIAVHAALGAVEGASSTLGWEYIGSRPTVRAEREGETR